MLPNYYQVTPSTAISSFNFTEFATGKGIVSFYPVTSSGANILATQTSYNWTGNTNKAGFSSNGNIRSLSGETIDLDFDVEFDRAINVRGVGTLNFESVVTRISGGSASHTATFQFNLYKVAGATENLMAQASHGIVATLDNGASANQAAFYSFDLSSTHFAIGDKLRLNFLVTSSAPSGQYASWLLTDSKNRSISIGDFTSTFSSCLLNIPVTKDL